MNDLKKYTCFILIILSILSCREKFDTDIANSEINVLVVQGEINDGPGPYMVKLTRSIPFTKELEATEKKAEVYVLDDLDNKYIFKETNDGYYYSDSGSFKGQIGRVYTLFVNTNDGLKYKSSPCAIGQPSDIDSAYCLSNGFSSKYIYTDISFKSEQKISIKIDASVAIMTEIDSFLLSVLIFNIIDPTSIPDTIDSTWVPTLITKLEYDTTQHITRQYTTTRPLYNAPVLKTNTDYVAGSKVQNVFLFDFLHPVIKFDSSYIDSLNWALITSGFNPILIINVSTISNETYDYYYKLLNQTGAKNTFFEPIPIQITGNIKCINNSAEIAYGLFQANSVVKNYYRFENNELMIKIDSIPKKTMQVIEHNPDTSYFLLNKKVWPYHKIIK